ncbi:MAG: tetratricopeptide repeat protein [Paracoccaceae bacterium]
MRILSSIGVVLLLSALTAPARAGTAEDCGQDGDLDLKISACTALIDSGERQGKDLAWAYYNRGFAYRKRGKFRRAIKDFGRTLKLDPGSVAAYNDRGIAYRNLGDPVQAIKNFDHAVQLDPEYAPSYNNRAWALYFWGKNSRALGDADRALSLAPNIAAPIDTRAHILAALGRRQEALAEFERAMQVGGADQVRVYQEALAEHGYYKGTVDGTFGPQVRAALAACLDDECRLLE